jgi:Holliday junction resolvase RusA-like endonuclease
MDSPPTPDELTIHLLLPPVSQQARSESKVAFQAKIRKALAGYNFLLSGDVSVAVEWSVSQEARYETDRSPDVDNILKPLLDALVGPEGVMIDDSQVQHVSCNWVDSYAGDETLRISLRYSPDEWLRKERLCFVQLESGLCLPLAGGTSPHFQRTVVDVYVSTIRLRAETLRAGVGHYAANMCMPVQRLFHRTRLAAFQVVSEAEFRAQNAL